MADVPGVPEFKGTAFALPSAVLEAHRALITALAARRITWTTRTLNVEPFRVPAVVFEAPTESVALDLLEQVVEVFGPMPFQQRVDVRSRRRDLVLFTGVAGTVTIMKVSADSDEPDSTAYKTYAAVLERFSRLLGGLVGFELNQELDRPTVRAPRPDAPGHIRIFTYAVPPGELNEQRVVRAFGLPLDKDARAVRSCLPAPSRGTVLRDDEGDLIQILGNTWYFLLPMVDIYNDGTSREIFANLVHSAWEHWRKPQPPERRSSATRKKFCAASRAWTTKARQTLDTAVMSLDTALERMRQDVARLQCDRNRFALMRAAITNQQEEAVQADLAVQWRRLRKHPHIERLEMDDEGLNVVTKSIMYAHGGKQYWLGRFVVRVGVEGVVSVWNLDILHPEGVPHPHIKKNGGPCFGNSDDAITQAAAEHRYADAVEYALRWLTEGYHPPLALAKIEEWPEAPVDVQEVAS